MPTIRRAAAWLDATEALPMDVHVGEMFEDSCTLAPGARESFESAADLIDEARKGVLK